MRLFGVLLLLAAGTALGLSAAARLDARTERIRLLRRFLQAAVSELQCSLPTVAALLRMLAAQEAFCSLRFLQDAAADADRFPDCWPEALRADRSLTAEERAVLETVGQTLGSTTLEGQISALALCQARLETMEHDAAALAGRKGTLYRSMGLLGSMFLAILLL